MSRQSSVVIVVDEIVWVLIQEGRRNRRSGGFKFAGASHLLALKPLPSTGVNLQPHRTLQKLCNCWSHRPLEEDLEKSVASRARSHPSIELCQSRVGLDFGAKRWGGDARYRYRYE
jgi:hypothetical protein